MYRSRCARGIALDYVSPKRTKIVGAAMGYHLPLQRLHKIETARPSFVSWCHAQPSTAVFFIHGFGGSALATWRSFDSLATELENYRTSDLFFLGYRSLRDQTEASASRLFDVCNSLLRGSVRHTRPKVRYARAVFLAHSLGAVVTRKLLLIAQARGSSWLKNTRMILFAPAHMGATDVRNLPAAMADFAGPFSPLLGYLVRWRVQTLRELESGSPTLMRLQQATAQAFAARKRGTKGHLVAERVLFGDNENVVDMNPFFKDPPHDRVSDKGHIDICKPSIEYATPLTLI
jgi:pimeloyl-ACP methyl ester carboxylesterase